MQRSRLADKRIYTGDFYAVVTYGDHFPSLTARQEGRNRRT
jgi:hypothetical protein